MAKFAELKVDVTKRDVAVAVEHILRLEKDGNNTRIRLIGGEEVIVNGVFTDVLRKVRAAT